MTDSQYGPCNNQSDTPRSDNPNPRAAPLWLERGLFEVAEGNVVAAREAFERGAAVTPPYPPVFEAWAALEAAAGQEGRAEEIAAVGVAAGGRVGVQVVGGEVQVVADSGREPVGNEVQISSPETSGETRR
jgi:hypothetical protein